MLKEAGNDYRAVIEHSVMDNYQWFSKVPSEDEGYLNMEQSPSDIDLPVVADRVVERSTFRNGLLEEEEYVEGTDN